MSQDTASAPSHTRYAALDGLRGIAVLVVLLLHFTLIVPTLGLDRLVHGALQAGWIGVDLFFVLSGFLITGILYDSKGDPGFFRNFYGRRVLRIIPLYYAYLFLLFVIFPAVMDSYAAERAAEGHRQIWLWTHLGNILMARDGWEGMPSHTTHLWSLAVEEQFYLLWPLVVFLLPRKNIRNACLALFGGAVATRLWLFAQGDHASAYLLTPARMDTLAMGAFVAIHLRERGAEATRAIGRVFLALGPSLIAGGIAWSVLLGSREFLPPLDPGTQTLAYPGLAMTFAGVIALAVTTHAPTVLTRTLSIRPLRFFGKYSYALYVLHMPLRNALLTQVRSMGELPTVAGSQLPAQALLMVLGIALSVCIALVSWHLLESPFLSLKRHFEPAGAPSPSRADAVASV